MSRLEDRLRDAYQGAVDTVTAEAIRDPERPSAPRPRGPAPPPAGGGR